MTDATVTTASTIRDATTAPVTSYRRDQHIQETRAMLLDEELARSRIREHRYRAAQTRLANRVAAAHRWDRLAGWAARRALRAHEKL